MSEPAGDSAGRGRLRIDRVFMQGGARWCRVVIDGAVRHVTKAWYGRNASLLALKDAQQWILDHDDGQSRNAC